VEHEYRLRFRIGGRDPVGYGINKMVKWHKREREHLLQALGITVQPFD
jgi:hypothetical protein